MEINHDRQVSAFYRPALASSSRAENNKGKKAKRKTFIKPPRRLLFLARMTLLWVIICCLMLLMLISSRYRVTVEEASEPIAYWFSFDRFRMTWARARESSSRSPKEPFKVSDPGQRRNPKRWMILTCVGGRMSSQLIAVRSHSPESISLITENSHRRHFSASRRAASSGWWDLIEVPWNHDRDNKQEKSNWVELVTRSSPFTTFCLQMQIARCPRLRGKTSRLVSRVCRRIVKSRVVSADRKQHEKSV